MSGRSQIEVQELRRAVEHVLDAVAERHGPTVDLEADYYASLDLRTSFDPTVDQCDGITVGQLSDDVREVREMLSRTDAPVVWHDLSHIAAIFLRIAALDLPEGRVERASSA